MLKFDDVLFKLNNLPWNGTEHSSATNLKLHCPISSSNGISYDLHTESSIEDTEGAIDKASNLTVCHTCKSKALNKSKKIHNLVEKGDTINARELNNQDS